MYIYIYIYIYADSPWSQRHHTALEAERSYQASGYGQMEMCL